jgi:hypothetical protein
VPLHPDEILSDEIEGDTDLEGIDDNNDDDDDNAFDPPGSMRELDEDLVDEPSSVLLHENHPLPVDAEIAVGVTFYNKNDCKNAIKKYHIKHSIQCHTEKSDHTRYVIRCSQEQCRFKLRAAHSKKTELWSIIKINDNHTCISSGMTQDHRNLDAKMIAESIMPLMRDNLSVRPDVIIAHIRSIYNCTISYKKAWHAKNKAIEAIYGNWVQSFNDLP